MAAAINLQRDAGVMLSNLQILSQFVTSLHRMSTEMLNLAPRADPYMAALGLWRPQMGPGHPGPVLASFCNSCMNCQYCFPKRPGSSGK